MRFARVLIVAVVVALVAAPAALAIRFTDDSYFTPQGVVGQPYSHWFKGDGGCGPALPYQFRILGGSLPQGLTLAKNGLVSGTPTQSGSWSFWVELSDEDPPSASWCIPKQAQREFTITVVGGSPGTPPTPPSPAPLTITTSSAPPGTVGVPYSLGMTASGGGTQTWSVAGGTLPPGLTLPATGALSGTPTTAGDYTFTVEVRDGARSGSKQLTINVSPALTIATSSAPPGTVGVPYSLGLTADGGGTQAWSVTAGTSPPGLALNSSTGALAGTPATAGDYSFTVLVQDGRRSNSKQFTVAVRNPLAIATPKVPLAEVDVALKPLKLVARGGTGSYTWKLEEGSVPGLSFNPATAVPEGTPTAAGSFGLKFSVTDSESRTATVDVTLTVNAQLAIVTKRLRVARVGRLYGATLATSGGAGRLKWKVVAGRFPLGLRLNKATGTILGTPRRAGVSELTFGVRDGFRVTHEVTLELVVLKAKKR